eukprot:2711941-Ditylum_brightwellii.AAC.1
MAMHSAHKSVPPTGDAKPLDGEALYAKMLVMPTVDNGLHEKTISQSRYNYRWRLTFLAPKNDDILPR